MLLCNSGSLRGLGRFGLLFAIFVKGFSTFEDAFALGLLRHDSGFRVFGVRLQVACIRTVYISITVIIVVNMYVMVMASAFV